MANKALNEAEQEALKTTIVVQCQNCCDFLGVVMGDVILRLDESGTSIVGEVEIEGKERYLPSLTPMHPLLIRMRLLNRLLPAAEYKWEFVDYDARRGLNHGQNS